MRGFIQLITAGLSALALAACGASAKGSFKTPGAGPRANDVTSLSREIDQLNLQLKAVNYSGLDGYLAGFWPNGKGMFTIVRGGTVQAKDRPEAMRLLGEVKARAETLAKAGEQSGDKDLKLRAGNVIAGALAGLQQLNDEDQADLRGRETKLL